MAALLAEAKRGPVVLETEVMVEDAERRAKVRTWWVQTQLPQMRGVAGVREARLLEHEDGRLVEHLVFGGERELAHYNELFAAEHRATFREACGRDLERTSRKASLRGRA